MDTPKRGLCELRALLPAAGGLWCPACPSAGLGLHRDMVSKGKVWLSVH